LPGRLGRLLIENDSRPVGACAGNHTRNSGVIGIAALAQHAGVIDHHDGTGFYSDARIDIEVFRTVGGAWEEYVPKASEVLRHSNVPVEISGNASLVHRMHAFDCAFKVAAGVPRSAYPCTNSAFAQNADPSLVTVAPHTPTRSAVTDNSIALTRC